MRTLPLSLELPLAELVRRLPRRAGAFLLDGGDASSWGRGEALLGWDPTRLLEFRGEPDTGGDPFALLEEAVRAEPCAGVVCALGYDLGRWIERLGPPRRDDAGLPRLFAAVHPWVLAYSYLERRYELRSPGLDAEALGGIAGRLAKIASLPPTEAPAPSPTHIPIASNFSRQDYSAAVGRVLDYIAAGDVYQVNLAQRFTAGSIEEPADLFARLLRRHPAPFSAYIDGGAWSVVSNSPECFLDLQGERITTYPIKGTRPRGDGEAADKAMVGALRSSIKDRAEHLMIVDLERNDLGRVCRFGSVRVPELARLRTFPSLHHLESVVTGDLVPGTSLATVLRATFPGGSITGAPKIRAMQIIDELETVGRGLYTGAIGFLTPESASLNIAIRTATVARGKVHYHAGGGIVADSDPGEEYEETQLKAEAFLATLEAADR